MVVEAETEAVPPTEEGAAPYEPRLWLVYPWMSTVFLCILELACLFLEKPTSPTNIRSLPVPLVALIIPNTHPTLQLTEVIAFPWNHSSLILHALAPTPLAWQPLNPLTQWLNSQRYFWNDCTCYLLLEAFPNFSRLGVPFLYCKSIV